MDIAGSAVGLVLLSPLFVLAGLAIKLDSRGPVFFRQMRVGRRDREFHILKFRTMVADADRRKSEIAHLNKHRGSDERMFKVERRSARHSRRQDSSAVARLTSSRNSSTSCAER